MREPISLYIDLDSLLDTRMGVLALLDPEKAAKLSLSPTYGLRVIDHFPDFDMEAYAERYAKRDEEVLKSSMTTRAYSVVQTFVQRVIDKTLDAPTDFYPQVYLNTYPYVISDDLKLMIGKALVAKLSLQPKMVFIHKSPEELTPGYCKARFNTMVVYDFVEWIEAHSITKAIQETPIPEVTLFTPILVKKLEEDVGKDLRSKFIDLMSFFQMHINVTFIPVDVFSSVLTVNEVPETDDVPEDIANERDFDDGF